MKKIMLTVAGMLLVSLMAANAQVTPETTTPPAGETGVQTDEQSNYSRDMEVIQPTDVPTSLRSTLGDAEYSGWEEGKVYRNTSTNEYLIVIGDEDAKVFRFDENGSRIEDLDAESNNSGSDMNQGDQTDMNQGDQPATEETGTTGDTGSTTTEPDGSSSTR